MTLMERLVSKIGKHPLKFLLCYPQVRVRRFLGRVSYLALLCGSTGEEKPETMFSPLFIFHHARFPRYS